MEIIVFLSVVIAIGAVLTSIVLVQRVKKQIAEMTDVLVGPMIISLNINIQAVMSAFSQLLLLILLPIRKDHSTMPVRLVMIQEKFLRLLVTQMHRLTP